MPSVLFVCTANVRRSPMAEVLFADWLRRNPVVGTWQVSSAGTWAVAGMPAEEYTCRAAAARNLDLSKHRARRITGELLAGADLAVCMTRSHQEALQAEFPACAPWVELFRGLLGQPYDVLDLEEPSYPAHAQLLESIARLVEQAGPVIVQRAAQA